MVVKKQNVVHASQQIANSRVNTVTCRVHTRAGKT